MPQHYDYELHATETGLGIPTVRPNAADSSTAILEEPFNQPHEKNRQKNRQKVCCELNQAVIVITNCRSSSPNRDDSTNRMRRRHRAYGGRRSMQLTWTCGTQRRVATMRWAPSGRALRTAGGRRLASYHSRSVTARRVNIQLISGLRAVNPLGTCPG